MSGKNPNNRQRDKHQQRKREKRRQPNSPRLNGLMETGMQNTLDWTDRKPRLAATVNVPLLAIEGRVLGLVVGTVAAWYTSGFSKFVAYAANIVAVRLLRAILQWLWVLKVTDWCWGLAARSIERREGVRVPQPPSLGRPDTTQVNAIIAPAVVALAIATILSTEDVEPMWLNSPWGTMLASAVGCSFAAAIEALCMPTNIQALWRNRHQYQERSGNNKRLRRIA